jgi:hypothetical protein
MNIFVKKIFNKEMKLVFILEIMLILFMIIKHSYLIYFLHYRLKNITNIFTSYIVYLIL